MTIRLADSVPTGLTERWEDELRTLPQEKRQIQLIRMLEKYLDTGYGAKHLGKPEIAKLVEDSLAFWDGEKYNLHAWVVMPNHVHILVQPFEGVHLFELLQSWKKYTSRQANKILGRQGRFWFREFYDRYMRDEIHYRRTVHYIDMNPVKAGLCREPADWAFSSARFGSAGLALNADLEISGPLETL